MEENSDQNQNYAKSRAKNSQLHQRFQDAECKLNAVREERNQLDTKFGSASSQWKDALTQLENRHVEIEATMADLQDLNEQLTESNAMLLDLKYQADKAEAKAIACDQEKTKFLARMSHEIRSPLSVILGYAEQILEDDVDLGGCQQIASQIRGTGDFILELINEVLDLSKIEAGGLVLAPADTALLPLLHEVHELFLQIAVKRGIEFELDLHFPLPEYISIDRHRFKQVLINLCSNAVKFTDRGSVVIKVWFEDNTMFFEVQDSGIGMSQDQMDRIFRPFTQAESTISSRFGGTGLGLYIAHEIIEHMSGALTVRSQLDHGSQFQISLPIALDNVPLLREDTVQTVTPDLVVPVHTLQGRVIVAEDTQDLQIILGAVLKKAGLDVVLVSNGQQAVDAFQEGAVDIVLLDVEMPVMDGVSALKAIREWEAKQAKQQVPIVALTAHAFKDDISRLMHTGFDDVITKPFKRPELLGAVRTWLEKSRSNEVNTP